MKIDSQCELNFGYNTDIERDIEKQHWAVMG